MASGSGRASSSFPSGKFRARSSRRSFPGRRRIHTLRGALGAALAISFLAHAPVTAQSPGWFLNTQITTWDFEESDGGFSGWSDWEWGSPSGPGPGGAHSGERCWGTVLDGPHSEYAYCRLEFPELEILSQNAQLRFHHWYEFEDGHDGGQVRISLDGGLTWTSLEPEEGYGGEIELPSGARVKAFTGTVEGWEEPTFRITGCFGQTIKLQCIMWSDEAPSLAGWYVDDVVLIDAVPAARAAGVEEHGLAPLPGGVPRIAIGAARPSPFREGTEIDVELAAGLAAEPVSVEIVSVQGRLVRRLFEGPAPGDARLRLHWDGRDARGEAVAPGVYLARASAGSWAAVRRIIRSP